MTRFIVRSNDVCLLKIPGSTTVAKRETSVDRRKWPNGGKQHHGGFRLFPPLPVFEQGVISWTPDSAASKQSTLLRWAAAVQVSQCCVALGLFPVPRAWIGA